MEPESPSASEDASQAPNNNETTRQELNVILNASPEQARPPGELREQEQQTQQLTGQNQQAGQAPRDQVQANPNDQRRRPPWKILIVGVPIAAALHQVFISLEMPTAGAATFFVMLGLLILAFLYNWLKGFRRVRINPQ